MNAIFQARPMNQSAVLGGADEELWWVGRELEKDDAMLRWRTICEPEWGPGQMLVRGREAIWDGVGESEADIPPPPSHLLTPGAPKHHP